jgi:hypothetical protein
MNTPLSCSQNMQAGVRGSAFCARAPQKNVLISRTTLIGVKERGSREKMYFRQLLEMPLSCAQRKLNRTELSYGTRYQIISIISAWHADARINHRPLY